MQMFWTALYFSILFTASLSFIIAFFFGATCIIRTTNPDNLHLSPEFNVKRADQLIRWGFSLLTLGMVIGLRRSNEMWGRYWTWSPTQITTLSAWMVYLIYMHLRWVMNRQGKKMMIFSVANFVLIIFIYTLSKILYP